MNVYSARTAAGPVKITPTGRGRASTLVRAAALVLLARGVTRQRKAPRHGRRRVSGRTSTRRAGAISNQGWSREFDEPIALPGGRTLLTLHDAATYITGLPKKESALAEWQAAIEALMLVADRGGPTKFARIGVMRALNRHVEREFDPSRKEKHWGRRKLARNQ
jgi:hypothetical protein